MKTTTGRSGSRARILVAFLWLLGVAGCAKEASEPLPEYDDSLLDVVWQRQAESRAAMDGYAARYRLLIEGDETRGELRNWSNSRYQISALKQGNRMRIETSQQVDQDIQFADDEWALMGPQQHVMTCQFVTNDRESACRHQRAGDRDALDIWFSSNSGEVHPSARGYWGMAQGLDIAGHAFSIQDGFSTSPLDDEAGMIGRMSGVGAFHARAIDGDSGRLIEVTYHRDGRIWMTAWVDPSQGYATVRAEHETGELPNGRRQQSSRRTRVKEFADGVWAPVLIEATREFVKPDGASRGKVRLDVDEMVMNQTFAPEQFRWRSLNYRGSQVYIHQEEDQTVQVSFLGKYLEPPLNMDEAQRALAEHFIRKLAY